MFLITLKCNVCGETIDRDCTGPDAGSMVEWGAFLEMIAEEAGWEDAEFPTPRFEGDTTTTAGHLCPECLRIANTETLVPTPAEALP